MRIAYLECFSGISGDMFLGALVDAGVPPRVLEETVAALGVGARLEISRVVRSGISATKVDVGSTARRTCRGRSTGQSRMWHGRPRTRMANTRTVIIITSHEHHQHEHSSQARSAGGGARATRARAAGLTEIREIIGKASISRDGQEDGDRDI